MTSIITGTVDRHASGRANKLLKQYDANNNSKLDAEEINKAKQDQLAKFQPKDKAKVDAQLARFDAGVKAADKNKDGVIDKAEAKAARQERGKEGPAIQFNQLIKKYDANKNGKLDADELKKARTDIQGKVDSRIQKRLDARGAKFDAWIKGADANKDGIIDKNDVTKGKPVNNGATSSLVAHGGVKTPAPEPKPPVTPKPPQAK